MNRFPKAIVALAGATLLASAANAAEGFQVRYNLSGTLGGEMFSPPAQGGWGGGIATTYIRVEKVTGSDGQVLTRPVPGGVVPLPAPVPSAAYPTYGPVTARVDGTGTLRQLNLGLLYVTQEQVAGGRLAFAFNLPFAIKRQSFGIATTTPPLQYSPAIPTATRTAVDAQFNSQYQAALASQAASETGEQTGIGDAEIQAGWLYSAESVRVLAGASLVMPTGKYSAAAGPDIGFGKFYTLRPAVQAAWLVTPGFGVSGKLTVGLNSRNDDNNLRSGNWVGVELAAGYKTPVGVIGVHGIRVQQYQDDSNNPWGASRLRANTAGLFFTTKIPVLDLIATLQYMTMTSSRNAKHGDFTQLRLVKLF